MLEQMACPFPSDFLETKKGVIITPKKYMVKVNGKIYEVEVEEADSGEPVIISKHESKPEETKHVYKEEGQSPVKTTKPVSQQTEEIAGDEEIVRAPMAGTIVKMKSRVGEMVKDGQTLLTLEAMKMENEILAPKDCKVMEILVKENQQVDMDQPLIKIK